MTTASLERWDAVWREATGAKDAERVYQELITLYSEAHRHYHNLLHISECLAEFDSARHLAKNLLAVELAIWFHDAVYDTHAADNEERSAELARDRIREVGGASALCDAVAALVMATKTHDPAPHSDAPLLVDVDLSIFGKPEPRFQEYEAQIRREYAWVPDATFAEKRSEILERFLARKRIYSTESFFSRYEQSARVNVRNSIRNLKAAG